MIAMNEACVSFRMGSEGFGIPLDQVAEVVPVGEITPVPLAPASILGLANLRGRVVTLLDLSRLVERPLPPAPLPEDRLALVLGTPWSHLALYVHAPVEISVAASQRVLRVASGKTPGADTPGEELQDETVGGPAESEGQILHLLSARDLVSRCERNLLAGFRGRN